MLKGWNKEESRETYRLFKNFQDYEYLVDINEKTLECKCLYCYECFFFYFYYIISEIIFGIQKKNLFIFYFYFYCSILIISYYII